jgi:hypothetical protein
MTVLGLFSNSLQETKVARGEFMDKRPDTYQSTNWTEEALLPTIALINLPHPTIPNLYQRCYEYVERGQWDWETEVVQTGEWLNGSDG